MLSCYVLMWTAESFLARLTRMQMWFPSLYRKTEKEVHLKTTVWDESPRSHVSCLEIKHIKQMHFFSFKRPECALYDVYVRVSPLCTMHAECKLSIRPILEIFHLGQTCFPCMWCSSNIVRGRSWPSQETPLTSVRRYSLLIWKPAKMCSDRKPFPSR